MTAIGALIGLILSILLIIKKIPPIYSLILGAVVGGLIGGFSLPQTVVLMLDGVKDIMSAVLRILAAGVLSGMLVKTGAAASISNTIVHTLNERHTFLALALATMLLTAIGVFIDVAVITVAPIALSLGQRLSIPKGTLLIAMIGGGKCGNIISPNPNTIVAAENFGADLSSVMFVNIVPIRRAIHP
ncbi:gluconate:H+ symporter [termite gut metagenome]|uniref:Gluconate:H+ symporter n=1 Tax=termite gut metagenome TaxID=433724 RepID=A0A5J4QBE4_9ZZZZ